MLVSISKENYEEIVKHARKEFPLECCGLISGIINDGKYLIKDIYNLYNVDQSSEHFSMDPKEQLATIKKIRKQGYVLLGNYHSHPHTPSRPSDEDIRLAYDEELIYGIVSLEKKEPVLNFFKINQSKQIEKLELEIVNE